MGLGSVFGTVDSVKIWRGAQFSPSLELRHVFSISEIGIASADTLSFELGVEAAELARDSTYCVFATLHADERSILLPEWIAGWTMDLSRLDYWVRHPSEFEGHTTQYLTEFSEPLARKYRPALARLVFDLSR